MAVRDGHAGRQRHAHLGAHPRRRSALPFRHFEAITGHQQVIAMEVFDHVPRNYPHGLREAYGDLLNDPAKMAQYCVEELGAQAISVRLDGTHPDNGDRIARGSRATSSRTC